MMAFIRWNKNPYLRLLGALILLQVAACGSHNTSITTTADNAQGIPIPQAITAALQGSTNLSAFISVDDGPRQQMTISGGSASITLSNIASGNHVISIEFDYAFSQNPSKPLTLAGASKVMTVTAGQNSLSFAGTVYETQKYDEDQDGVSNLDELINNTNPFASVSVSPISGNTGEDGTQATFTVVLTSQPAANVTVGLSSSDTTEGLADTTALTFTPTDWDSPQTVTVTGLDDTVIDGNVAYTIVTAPVISADPNFDKLDPVDVDVVNIDNNTASFVESAILNHTNENGASVSFSVVLSVQPNSNVTVPVKTSNANEGTVSPATLTFTPANWNIATDHIVTVKGVDDSSADGPQSYQVILDPATSLDSHYDGQDPPDLTATNEDNDTPGISVGTLSNAGHTSESAGGTVTFDLTLNTPPSSSVTIDLASSNTSEGNVSPSTVVFDSTNWNQPQTITVTGVDDTPPVADGPQTYTISLSKPVSSDNNYSQLSATDVTLVNDDNEPTPSIKLSFDQTAIDEDSGTATPTANTATLIATSDVASTKDMVVTLNFNSGTAILGTDYTVKAGSITIPAGSVSGTTTLTTIPDTLYEGDETVVPTILSVTNGAADTSTSPASLTITDNDPLPLVVLSVDKASISETSDSAGTATIKVSLENAAGAAQLAIQPVTVNLTYSGSATPGNDYSKTDSITIPANSSNATATIVAIPDTVYEGDETVVATISSVNGNADAGSAAPVSTTIIDDDLPVVSLDTGGSANGTITSVSTTTVNLGDTVSFTVQPNTDYVAYLSSNNCGETLDPITNIITTTAISNNCTISVGFMKPFITTWQTDIVAATGHTTTSDTQLKIGTNTTGVYTYDYYVDWGDTKVDSRVTGDIVHDYAKPGTYVVKIYGKFPQLYFSDFPYDNEKLLSVDQWGDIQWRSMHNTFYFCTNMVMNAKDSPDLSQVTDMSYMFAFAWAFNSDINSWDVSHVTNMNSLFWNAKSFEQSLSGWNANVASVTDMSHMFEGAAKFTGTINGGVDGWKATSVKTVLNMFKDDTVFNGDLSNWFNSPSAITNMSGMFWGASPFNADLSRWNVSTVTNMSNMFSGTTLFNADITKWDVSNVTDMSGMFGGTGAFNRDISRWITSSVKNMSAMFTDAKAFTISLGPPGGPGWDVSKVTDMNSMFLYNTTYNGDISAWNVSSVTDMSYMFYGTTVFNGDLSNWNVSKVTNMSGMFGLNSVFSTNITGWTVSSVTKMVEMFRSATSFDEDISGWDVSNVKDMTDMFVLAGLSTPNYDALLKAWSLEPLQTGVNFNAGFSKYTTTDPAVTTALTVLTNKPTDSPAGYGWIITYSGP